MTRYPFSSKTFSAPNYIFCHKSIFLLQSRGKHYMLLQRIHSQVGGQKTTIRFKLFQGSSLMVLMSLEGLRPSVLTNQSASTPKVSRALTILSALLPLDLSFIFSADPAGSVLHSLVLSHQELKNSPQTLSNEPRS